MSILPSRIQLSTFKFQVQTLKFAWLLDLIYAFQMEFQVFTVQFQFILFINHIKMMDILNDTQKKFQQNCFGVVVVAANLLCCNRPQNSYMSWEAPSIWWWPKNGLIFRIKVLMSHFSLHFIPMVSLRAKYPEATAPFRSYCVYSSGGHQLFILTLSLSLLESVFFSE